MEPTLWHPNGWAHLGLSSPAIGHVDGRRSAASIRAAVEAAEQRAGAAWFSAEGLERLNVAAAGELAHTYLGLRHRYPGVNVDYLDFGAPPGDVLGYAELYPAQLETLHHTAVQMWLERGEVAEPSELLDAVIPEWAEHARVEHSWLPRRGARRPRDLACAGSIHLSGCLGHPACYRRKIAHWDRKRAIAQRRGTLTWLPELRTSIASVTLAHEFGHLLEATMWSDDPELATAVYGELSAELFGGDAGTSPGQWRRHLVNYPATLFPDGPAAGRGTRRRLSRRHARRDIGWRLGRYAIGSREELFAESFALAVTGTDRGLQTLFARRIRPLLAEAGIARR